jgi:hypothetical protein
VLLHLRGGSEPFDPALFHDQHPCPQIKSFFVVMGNVDLVLVSPFPQVFYGFHRIFLKYKAFPLAP